MVFYLYREKRQTNRLLSEKNIVVERSLHERETLLKEIHHRVKNNLQIISSLLSLQSKSLQDTEAQGAISESRNRVKSMSLIHEQLYQDETISGVDMKDYIERLVHSLSASYALDTERVQVKVAAEPLLLDVDTAIPLGLIMNELVSNSMKYAFPELRAGIIKISLEEMLNELRLVVEDNGVGIDPSKATSQSFGLSMVRSLMRKLKAEMNIGSNAGTSVELIIRDFKKVTFA
jgi:two-component system, sensor histidine kinase PdtaS